MKFLRALFLFIRMYRDGFYFSSNTRSDLRGRWGFYRFNYKSHYALFDIDFLFSETDNFIYIHGQDFRVKF